VVLAVARRLDALAVGTLVSSSPVLLVLMPVLHALAPVPG